METDELIRTLAADARPVRRMRPPLIRAAGWGVLALTSLAVGLLVMGARRELGEGTERALFGAEAFLLLVTAVSAVVGALLVSVPGAERSPVTRWLPVAAAAASVAWVMGELVYAAVSGAPLGRFGFAWQCVVKTTTVAMVPGAALFVMLRRAAPLHPGWAGLLATLATTAVGVLGANIICPLSRPLHLLLWHVGPLVLFAGAGVALGAWLLRPDFARR